MTIKNAGTYSAPLVEGEALQIPALPMAGVSGVEGWRGGAVELPRI